MTVVMYLSLNTRFSEYSAKVVVHSLYFGFGAVHPIQVNDNIRTNIIIIRQENDRRSWLKNLAWHWNIFIAINKLVT